MMMHGLANPKLGKDVPFEIYQQVIEVLGILRV
jgi:type III secretion system FlhB-like substrate exporter